jgi:hypothetical protein
MPRLRNALFGSKSLAERLSQVCRPFASRGDRAFAATASDDTLGRTQEARPSRILVLPMGDETAEDSVVRADKRSLLIQ